MRKKSLCTLDCGGVLSKADGVRKDVMSQSSYFTPVADNVRRDPFYDAIKGIGYLLVLCGHMRATSYIFNFHMPLFFFISGLFFSADNESTFGDCLRKIWKNIGIAWVMFFVIGVCVYGAIGHLGPSGGIIRSLAFSFYRGRPFVCNSLWFLTCLGITHVIWWLARRCSGRMSSRIDLYTLSAFVAFSGLIGVLASYVPHKELYPMMILSVPMALFFYGGANLIRDRVFAFVKIAPTYWHLGLFFVSIVSYMLISKHCGYSNMMYPLYSDKFMFLVTAILGIIITTSFVRLVSCDWVIRVLSFIGRCSICYFLIEEYSIGFSVLILKCWNQNLSAPVYHSSVGPIWWAIVAMMTIAVSTALMPFLMGALCALKRRF